MIKVEYTQELNDAIGEVPHKYAARILQEINRQVQTQKVPEEPKIPPGVIRRTRQRED